MRYCLLEPLTGAIMKLAFAFLVVLVVRTPVGLAQVEDPSAAAVRLYGEYMGMGVALKPLGERWFTLGSGASWMLSIRATVLRCQYGPKAIPSCLERVGTPRGATS